MRHFVRTFALAAVLMALVPTAARAQEAPPTSAPPPVDIVILGGTAVVPESVEYHLASCTEGSVSRIAGSNRYATAAAISRRAFPGGAKRAYVAVGTNYPDAIAASVVAALNNAPLLLAKPDALPGETAAELRRLGVAEVFILGGDSVISMSIENQLSSAYAVTRLFGANRYATAAVISSSTFTSPVDIAYIATGTNFPDALVGGPAAYAYGGPILLTDPAELSPETAAELERLQPSSIVVLGGTGVVSSAVEQSLAAYGAVSRLAGRDRYATAATIGQALPSGVETVYLTTGQNFPDALAATPLVHSNPVLLTSESGLPHATASVISSFTGQPCTPLVKVSEFTTYHPAGQSRVTNIHLIADATNGALVLPGEVFSLNEHVGERTAAKGYVAAGAIINGEIYCCDHPANIGGGTSQFATTLYNAIFFGAYEDVYHSPHSIWFDRYPMGREATLGWKGPDVQFRNDTNAPVMIRTRHTSTSITVEFWGWNDGRKVSTQRVGDATTSDGGLVRVDRTITYADGTSKTQSWWHRYNPLHPEAL